MRQSLKIGHGTKGFLRAATAKPIANSFADDAVYCEDAVACISSQYNQQKYSPLNHHFLAHRFKSHLYRRDWASAAILPADVSIQPIVRRSRP